MNQDTITENVEEVVQESTKRKRQMSEKQLFFYVFREFLTNIQAKQIIVLRKIHIRTFLKSQKSKSDNA